MILISRLQHRWPAASLELPLAASLVGLDVMARLLPHAPNFTPVAASALFAGMMLRSRMLAVAVPVLAMLLSDLVLGGDDWRIMCVIYAALAMPAGLGIWARRFGTLLSAVPSALVASSIFFATTNFAVWAFSGMYAKTLAGLLACYVAAIPFFQNTLGGDLVWTGVLFGGWLLARSLWPAKMARA